MESEDETDIRTIQGRGRVMDNFQSRIEHAKTLKQECPANRACIDSLLGDLLEENKRLQAIVDKLPKTADGVPVAPGDKVYRAGEYTSAQLTIARDLPEYNGGWQDGRVRIENCYSTREAAQAALDKGGE